MSAIIFAILAGLLLVYVGTGIGLIAGWSFPRAAAASLSITCALLSVALLVIA